MQIVVTMNMQDIYRMLRHVHLGQYRMRNAAFFGLTVLSVIASVYILFSPEIALKKFYLLAPMPVLYLVILPITIIFQAKSIFSKQEVFKKPLKYRFLDKGIETINSKAKSMVEWTDLHKVDETGQDFIFFLNRAHAFSIPKKKMEGKEDALRSIILKNLPEGKFRV